VKNGKNGHLMQIIFKIIISFILNYVFTYLNYLHLPLSKFEAAKTLNLNIL